jgi:hypothetical protein
MNLVELQNYHLSLSSEKSADDSVRMMRRFVIFLAHLIETCSKWAPAKMDINLDRFGEQTTLQIENYDDDLYEIYFDYSDQVQMNPFSKIALKMCSSAFMFSHFKKCAAVAPQAAAGPVSTVPRREARVVTPPHPTQMTPASEASELEAKLSSSTAANPINELVERFMKENQLSSAIEEMSRPDRNSSEQQLSSGDAADHREEEPSLKVTVSAANAGGKARRKRDGAKTISI